MPGDPIDIMVNSNPKMSSADVIRLKSIYGLDQPFQTQYYHWIQGILKGDFGYSRTYRIPVMQLLGPRLLNTFFLSFFSLLVSLAISIPLGIWSALNAGKRIDYIINFFAFTGISVPSFWLGIVLILAFAVKWPLLPAGGTFTIGMEDASFFEIIKDRATYLILPTLSLSYLQIGRFVRFIRSAMLESLRNDYIRTAKAKGLNFRKIIWKHAFRNALIPLITIMALSFSNLFSGALITETVFAYQGVGKLVEESIIANDYNVAMVAFMISVSMVLIFNLLADILYGAVDPRITYN